MHANWAPVWQSFHDALAHESVAIQLSVWVGMALILVLALEGLRVTFAPGAFVRRYLAHRQAHPHAHPHAPGPASRETPRRIEPVAAAAGDMRRSEPT